MTTTKNRLIHELLLDRRKELGHYQTTASDAIGVSRNQYRQWESTHAVPGDRWIEPLIAYLDISEDELVMTLSRSRRARQRKVIHVMSSCVVSLFPTVRAHETTDWDQRPIDFYAQIPDAA